MYTERLTCNGITSNMTVVYPNEVIKALENPQVKNLFEVIDRQTPITFRLSMGESWGELTQNGSTVIEFAPTKTPAEALGKL